MSLTLHMHPLSSYCHKVLIALYENNTSFRPHMVDLADARARDAFYRLWPVGRFPVLHDSARDRLVPESSIIIEYLQLYYPGAVPLLPSDSETALQVRQRDRFFDQHVHEPLQKIITDRLRPIDQRDHFGVAQARQRLYAALDLFERDMAQQPWAAGETFGMADCAAAPPLFYCNLQMPLEDTHPHTAAYLLRVMQRPSYTRVLTEAEPYLHMLPREPAEA
ncbi:glutathione S-transferase family protein [Dyella sp. ASV21]|uniref:glutathione S-transferase family protein n=1 Tax=Dyella sp. ASV21 TaxID=2795114 RepID=UPI0018EDB9B8|nr:glutathione S-transferase family protein [Dyella sp. ASV21]